MSMVIVGNLTGVAPIMYRLIHKCYNKTMMIANKCFYCLSQVDTDIKDGSWIYTIDHDSDHLVQFAHTECAEITDGLIINETEF